MNFNELGLIEPILKALEKEGYKEPTPIQEQAIPFVLKGSDLLGCAQTGTGKTAAFTLPIVQQLFESDNKKGVKALILTPTRELAIQIGECLASYTAFTNVRYAVLYGGVGQQPQVDALKKGAQIVVATPGRLLDLQTQGLISLKGVDYFVLDEADRMLDMGFIHDIRKVLKLIPVKRQTLFFSATMPKEIESLAGSILTNPVQVEVTPASSTVETIRQCAYRVEKPEKKQLLLHLLQDVSLSSVLVFTRTKYGADAVARFLTKRGVKAEAIHGEKSQNARQKALSHFKEHSLRVLVATDIAARGIDVDQVSHVINYELPNVPETYVHRIGRTGRAGHEGVAIAFCSEEEMAYKQSIEKLAHIDIPFVNTSTYVSGLVSAPSTPQMEPTQTDRQKQNKPKANQQKSANVKDEKPKANQPRNEKPKQNQRKEEKPKSNQTKSEKPRQNQPKGAVGQAKKKEPSQTVPPTAAVDGEVAKKKKKRRRPNGGATNPAAREGVRGEQTGAKPTARKAEVAQKLSTPAKEEPKSSRWNILKWIKGSK